MPIQWNAKSPNEVIAYNWEPELAEGDNLQSFSLAVSTGTVVIDSEEQAGDLVIAYIAGGANGETAIITATGITTFGEEIEDAIYLPIRTKPNSFNYSVSEVLQYALRPVVGLAATPTSSELEDARENFDDMVASWAAEGADLSIKLPSDTSDMLYVPDYAINALKANLRVRIAGLYEKPVDMNDYKSAMRGLQHIKSAKLPVYRDGSEYF